jgi:AraC-like DNA-binding protein
MKVLSMALALLLLTLGAIFLWVQRRNRNQMEALMARLAELEESRADIWAAAASQEGAGADDGGSPTPPTDSMVVSADVLHGMTTHVQRMVAGEGVEAAGLADQAIVRIHAHIEENLTAGQLAEELHVSLRTLQRGLAAALDCTPRQLILAMKMREARRLLETGRYRVSEVAYRLAFSSPHHFSSRFKSFYRKAPSQVVKKAR